MGMETYLKKYANTTMLQINPEACGPRNCRLH